MQVTSVSVTVRESRESSDGWRTLELGAEAQVFPNEDWREAQQALCEELNRQMDALGIAPSEGTTREVVMQETRPAAAKTGRNGNGSRAPKSQAEEEVVDATLVCPEHHKAKRGKYGLYCPTKMADGTWCTWQMRN